MSLSASRASAMTPDPGAERPLLHPALMGPGVPRRGATPAPGGTSPKLRRLFNTQASDDAGGSPTKERALRLPSNIAAARRQQERARTVHDVGTFGFRNPYVRIVGETRNGAPCGYGVVYLSDGGSVEGTFDASGELTCDDGCRRWADGSTYTGPLLKGEAHGEHGVYHGADASEYRGSWAFGQRSGKGVFTDRVKQLQYHGQFQRGLFHGHGELTDPRVHVMGYFARGRPEGRVAIEYSNGDRWEGPCVAGRPHVVPPPADDDAQADSRPLTPTDVIHTQPPTPGDAPVHRFVSAATGVTYTGPMLEGKRPPPPNVVVALDVMVNGAAVPPTPSLGPKKKSGFTRTVAAAAADAGMGDLSTRLARTLSAKSSASLKPAAKSVRGKASVVGEPARYVQQFTSTAERMVTAPFNKPLCIRVALGRRDVARIPTLASSVRKATGKAKEVEPVINDTPLPHEVGRTLRAQLFPLPTNQGAGFPGSGMRQLAEYHERVSPAPVLMLAGGDSSVVGESVLSPVSDALSCRTDRSLTDVSPSNTSATASPPLSRHASAKLPPLRKGTSASRLQGKPSPPAPPPLPKPTVSELLVPTDASGAADFALRLADPGAYYLRVDVEPSCRAVQREPGSDALTAEERTALDGAVGYFPLRLIRQC